MPSRREVKRRKPPPPTMPGDGRNIDAKYIAWIREQKGFSEKEAIAYVAKGQAGLEALAPRARTRPEVLASIDEDRGEALRRWNRVDQPCPAEGCIYPINHSGPHRRHAASFERAESLDEFEGRFADDPGPEIQQGDDGGTNPDT